jgi:hypothetical protein
MAILALSHAPLHLSYGHRAIKLLHSDHAAGMSWPGNTAFHLLHAVVTGGRYGCGWPKECRAAARGLKLVA